MGKNKAVKTKKKIHPEKTKDKTPSTYKTEGKTTSSVLPVFVAKPEVKPEKAKKA